MRVCDDLSSAETSDEAGGPSFFQVYGRLETWPFLQTTGDEEEVEEGDEEEVEEGEEEEGEEVLTCVH